MNFEKEHSEEIRKEIESLAPNFSKIPKEGKQEAPANYFNSLQDEVMKKIHAEEAPQFAPEHLGSQEISTGFVQGLLKQFDDLLGMIFQPKPAYALATITACLLVSIYVFRFSAMEVNPADQLAEISLEELDAYVLENMEIFDESLIVENTFNESVESMQLDDFDAGYEDFLDDSFLDEIDDDIFEEAFM